MSRILKNALSTYVLTVFLGIIVCLSLIYFGVKYYAESKLIFEQNQFAFYLIFVLLVIWVFGYMVYQNRQLKKSNMVITDLLQSILNEQILSQDATERLHQNSRQIILTAIENRKVAS